MCNVISEKNSIMSDLFNSCTAKTQLQYEIYIYISSGKICQLNK